MSAIYPECPICFESLDHDLITSITCGHIFHRNCLNSWMTINKMICPICRGNASVTVQLIYDIKFTQANSQKASDTIQSTQEILKQNKKLMRSNEILTDEVAELKAQYKIIQGTIDESIHLYKTLEKSNKDYKQNALLYHVKYSECQEHCELLKSELDKCTMVLRECEKEIKEKNSVIQTSKAVGDLMTRSDGISVKDTIEELMNKEDNGRTLTEYVYILQKKIDALQEENEELKKKKVIEKNVNESLYKKMDDSTFIKIIGDGYKPQKRKYNDFISDSNKSKSLNNDNVNESKEKEQMIVGRKGKDKLMLGGMIQNNSSIATNANSNVKDNNAIRLFNNPFGKITKNISFLNQNKK